MARSRRGLEALTLLVLLASTLAACAPASETPGEAMLADAPAGVPGEAPAEYQDLTNPLSGDPQAIAAGSEAYAALCSQCHGVTGAGDGQAGESLVPGPTDFTRQQQMAALSDGYLFWRISEGGAFDPFNSLMPAWGTLLSEREIWELVSYIRTLSS